MCCFGSFFFKQKTAYEMRISDWSSDVCSSDLETNRTLYVSLLSRLKELERQDDVGQSDANFISRAAVPLSPSYPATKRIMAVALVASLVMAAILAFIAESMDGRIRTSEQMESLPGFPALAMVPEKPETWGDLPPYVALI